MTTIEIMARISHLDVYGFGKDREKFVAVIERFAALVRADERNSWPAEMEAMERQVNILTDALAQEREACANLVFHSPPSDEYESPLVAVYNAIRARSNP